jgi:hypothetical protein
LSFSHSRLNIMYMSRILRAAALGFRMWLLLLCNRQMSHPESTANNRTRPKSPLCPWRDLLFLPGKPSYLQRHDP